jgi:RimJ/RimL family protein N-acetyltransferase
MAMPARPERSMEMIPPRLETPRLILRAPQMADYPDFAAMMQSDHSRYMGGPFSEEGAWFSFCHDTAQWWLMGCGGLMVETRADGVVVGQVGINSGPLFPEWELGWLVYAQYEGQGYAHEAALALRDWAFSVRGLPTLVSYIEPANVRSWRLAERLGAWRDPDAVRRDPDDFVYRHIRP